MSGAKHTPGPWQLDAERGEVFADDQDVCPLVATVNFENTSQDQALSDCRLIAAAPDLLAALMALLPEVDAEIEQRQTSGNDEYWQGLKALLDAGHAAVAKAEAQP